MTQRVNTNEFIDELSPFAMQQINDYRMGRTNARQQAVKTNSSLPERSWRTVESSVYEVKHDTLTLIQDLLDAGLRSEHDIMTKHDTWQLVDDQGESNTAMSPEVAGDEGSLEFGDDGVPVPVEYDFFSLGFREGSSPDSGDTPDNAGLDTLGLSTTTRRVNEGLERQFLNGWDDTINFDGDGYTLYGMTNHPQVNTATFDEDWTTTTEGSGGETLRDDVIRARGIVKNDNNYSPGGVGYWAYMGTELADSLDNIDPAGDGNLLIRDRIENLSGINRIRELEFLPDDAMLLFRPTEDVVDVGVAADVQPIMWEDPFRDNWAVLGSMYPRVKTTKTGQNGIVYMTPA